jgi:hypothetical protein
MPGAGAARAEPLATLTHVPDDTSRGPRLLAAALTGLQSVVLVGFAVFYLYELAVGEGSDAARVIMSALLILLGGLGLGALARGWFSTAAWPKTPTVVWSALLVPVGIGLIQGDQSLAGWGVLVAALVTAAAALLVPTPDQGVPGVDPEDDLPGRDPDA